LLAALRKLNPGLPEDAYDAAVRQVVEYNAAQSTLAVNEDKYALLRDGVQVAFRDARGELTKQRLKLVDFEEPENNHFLAVREFWEKPGQRLLLLDCGESPCSRGGIMTAKGETRKCERRTEKCEGAEIILANREL
jgi:hypothetical protein